MSSLNAFGEADYPLPIGVMTFWCGDVNGVVQPPQGWLICDGAEISKAEYPLLYEICGDQFGTAVEPINYFLLPNCIGGTETQSDGKLPLYKAVNTGIVDDGVAGTANLSFTLTEANMPSLPTFSSNTGVGIEASNTVWSSTVTGGTQVADNDTTGTVAYNAPPIQLFVPYNVPVLGASISPTQTNVNMVSRLTPAAPYTGTLPLNAEVPLRYEMPIIIKSSY